jgi:peptide/nickel transport system substrate-binding protein
MRNWKTLLASVLVASLGFGAAALAQEAVVPPITDFPRNETVILQNPEPPARNPGWFNIWAAGAGGSWSNGLHQLMLDTFWYIDPDAGINGSTYNSLATGPAVYSDDFTEMTVNLREGVLWSDGVEFTSDDVVFTVQKQQEIPTTVWHGAFSQVAEVTAPDKYTVHFKLKNPNSRFHSVFSVRWNAAWIMPKHIFEKVDDFMSFNFNPPVGLGPYTLHSWDPNGAWAIWEKRADWDKTAMAEFGEPKPRYIIYRSIVETDLRLIEMINDNLDVIHDLTPEGMFSIAKQDPTAKGWFPGFPYAHPDPTLPMVIFNHQKPWFKDKRVRWALTLMLDIKSLDMASYRGAATLSAIAIPPTGTHPVDYHGPLQEWISNYEIETGKQTIKPYDPNVPLEIADTLRPQFGDQIPTDEAAIRNAFGYGWWKQNVEAANELLESAGFTKPNGQWLMPDGTPFKFTLNIVEEGLLSRLGAMVAQNWKDAGIDVTAAVLPIPVRNDANDIGEYDAEIGWSVETWGGNPDLSFFLDSWHSQFLAAKPGDRQAPRNWQRWSDPRLDALIEKIRQSDFTDNAKSIEYGNEFVKLMVEEMPVIPLMSFNVFSVTSEKHWTNWPNSENNYANPVNNWANSRYMFTQIEPTGN